MLRTSVVNRATKICQPDNLGPWPNETKATIISILKLRGFSDPCHTMARDKGQRCMIKILRGGGAVDGEGVAVKDT